MSLNLALSVPAVLFVIGVYGVIARRNAIMVLMSLELMLNAANLNLIIFSLFRGGPEGQLFALFIIAVAAAEIGLGLGILIRLMKVRGTLDVDKLNILKW